MTIRAKILTTPPVAGDIYCQVCLKEKAQTVLFQRLAGKCSHMSKLHGMHWVKADEEKLAGKIASSSPEVRAEERAEVRAGSGICPDCAEAKVPGWQKTWKNLRLHRVRHHGMAAEHPKKGKRGKPVKTDKIDLQTLASLFSGKTYPLPSCPFCQSNLVYHQDAHQRTREEENMKHFEFLQQNWKELGDFFELLRSRKGQKRSAVVLQSEPQMS